jgi:hypothetical protein
MVCSINLTLVTDGKTGPTQTDELSVPVPDTNQTIDLPIRRRVQAELRPKVFLFQVLPRTM